MSREQYIKMSSRHSGTSESEFDDATPTTTSVSQNPLPLSKHRPNRRKKRRADEVWKLARKPVFGEPTRDGKRRIWYCKYDHHPAYSCLSTNGARYHMEHVHKINVPGEKPTKTEERKSKDLREMFDEQTLQKQEDQDEIIKAALTAAADPIKARAALVRLVIRHDLPLNLVTWPALFTFVHAINHMAKDSLFKSRSHLRRYIRYNYVRKRALLKQRLSRAQSLIHLGTDTWHSPNRHELQGITAHFLDEHGKLQKVLLALPELFHGHAGERVAPHLLRIMDEYGFRDKIGWIVSDNHGANDTLCRALANELDDFDAVERRLRCFCHMVNIPVQAFLYAENDAAVDYADSLISQERLDTTQQVRALTRDKATAGWLNNSDAGSKVLGFCKTLRASDQLYNAFKNLSGGKMIHAPNDTRWHSVHDTLHSARAVSSEYGQFTHKYPQLAKYEMSINDWQQIDDTLTFLHPFREVSKRCEGDYVTLDNVQESMDFLVSHYEQQRAIHKANPSRSHALYTSWFAFDKYYQRIDDTGIYAAALLLHPNCRKSYLEAEWKKSWVNSGIRRAKELWSKYSDSEAEAIEDDNLTAFEMWRANRQKKQRLGKASDEFTRFINAPEDNIKIPVLDWWQQPQQKEAYPRLQRMAIDVLTAPATSADGERVFSNGRRVIPWTRASLNPSTIEEILCMKHWMMSGLIDEHMELEDDNEVAESGEVAEGGEVAEDEMDGYDD